MPNPPPHPSFSLKLAIPPPTPPSRGQIYAPPSTPTVTSTPSTPLAGRQTLASAAAVRQNWNATSATLESATVQLKRGRTASLNEMTGAEDQNVKQVRTSINTLTLKTPKFMTPPRPTTSPLTDLLERKPLVVSLIISFIQRYKHVTPLITTSRRFNSLKLSSLDLSFTQIRSIDCLASHRFNAITHLDLRNTTGIFSISSVIHCPMLEMLGLSATDVTDIAPIATLVNLTHVFMVSTNIADLEPLSMCRKLKLLAASGSAVTRVSALAGLPSLSVLDLLKTGVTDVSCLQTCGRLSELNLNFTSVTSLEGLADLPCLATLNCNFAPVADYTVLGESGKFESLKEIQCSNLINTRPDITELLRGRGVEVW